MTIRVGVIGIGRRGQEWVRIVRETSGFDLAACVPGAGRVPARWSDEKNPPDGRAR